MYFHKRSRENIKTTQCTWTARLGVNMYMEGLALFKKRDGKLIDLGFMLDCIEIIRSMS